MKTTTVFLLALLFSFTISSCATTVRTQPSKVVVVNRLPRAHKVVYVRGVRYYKWNGVYHKKTRRGYVVVRI
ncbi:MAG: DUF6515 family protein [Lutibacter sp.]